METNRTNCLICGEDISYRSSAEEHVCFCCKKSYIANAVCKKKHYVCDNCHSLPADEFIMEYCLNTDSTNPNQLSQRLMGHPSVKIHGPEHHFLIPAALLTCYGNVTGNSSKLASMLTEAKKRAKNVLGGFCGFYGSCGAAVGVGIFMSIVTGATPLSRTEWRLTNLATSTSLREIAQNGGPRCCKRNTFIAIETAVNFVYEHLTVRLAHERDIQCTHSHQNKECLVSECKYYSNF